MAKVANNWNDLVKGSLARQTASTGANYFRGEVCRYKLEVN